MFILKLPARKRLDIRWAKCPFSRCRDMAGWLAGSDHRDQLSLSVLLLSLLCSLVVVVVVVVPVVVVVVGIGADHRGDRHHAGGSGHGYPGTFSLFVMWFVCFS